MSFTYKHVHLYMYMYYVFWIVRVHVYICTCTYIYICKCTSVYIYMYIHIHLYNYMYVHVLKILQLLTFSLWARLMRIKRDNQTLNYMIYSVHTLRHIRSWLSFSRSNKFFFIVLVCYPQRYTELFLFWNMFSIL